MPASPSISDSASQSSQHDPLRERVSTAFEKLVASATELNAISDEIAKPIATIEATLQRLNLGVWAWAKFGGETELVAGYFWDRSIGYAKVSRVWGIAIRARSGPLELVTPERTETETWRFNDAPRSYRIQALKKLPDLLEQLLEATCKTTAALKNQVAATNQVAETISRMSPSKPARRK